MNNKIELGDRVIDHIHKGGGIVWGITAYLHGCNRIHIMQETLDAGKELPLLVSDEPQVKIVAKHAYYIENNLPIPGQEERPFGGPSILSAEKHFNNGKK